LGQQPDEILSINREVVEAFNSGGMERTAPYFDEDVEVYDPDMPEGTRLRGRDVLMQAFGEMVGAFDTMQVREIDMYQVGDRVVSLIRTVGKGEGRRGEMELEMHDTHVTTFRGGKVVYWRIYHDRREAFEEVGLDPDDPGEPYRFEA
jgi:ketosteroid isomerase-like protein